MADYTIGELVVEVIDSLDGGCLGVVLVSWDINDPDAAISTEEARVAVATADLNVAEAVAVAVVHILAHDRASLAEEGGLLMACKLSILDIVSQEVLSSEKVGGRDKVASLGDSEEGKLGNRGVTPVASNLERSRGILNIVGVSWLVPEFAVDGVVLGELMKKLDPWLLVRRSITEVVFPNKYEDANVLSLEQDIKPL